MFQRIPLLFLLLFVCAAPCLPQVQLSPSPSFALGQPAEVPATDPKHCDIVGNTISNCRPNLVEGTELYGPQSVAVDPRNGAVYAADSFNNRVLGWTSATAMANSAKADLVVGQRDLLTVSRGGPGTSLQNGLNQPTAVAVDSDGNLFVVDAGNNRILRYPRPFEQPDDLKLADLVIGQANLNSSSSNAGGISARSIFTRSGNTSYRTGLAFDAQGNLWFTDSGNHRVLRYPHSALGAGAANQPPADLVLGQTDFTSVTAPGRNPDVRLMKNALRIPSALAFDEAGRLFVADELLRVLVFEPPFSSVQAASRILGILVVGQGQPNPPAINAQSIGLIQGNVWRPAEGVFCIGNTPFVVDTAANRILRFAPFSEWPAETEEAISPAAVAVIGQDSLESAGIVVNRGRPEPGADTLSEPVGAAVGPDGRVFVADSGNSRVLAFPDLSAAGPETSAAAAIGQPGFPNRAPNRIEGREFFFTGTLAGAGLATDWNADPPHMYVADTNNNRVLGFRDARKVRNGTYADVVIGQPGMFRSLINYPSNNPLTPTRTGLFLPTALAVDNEGNLLVADHGNGRVLRFPAPFSQPAGALQEADLVLGQLDFTSPKVTDATSRTMAGPWGLHFSVDGSLLVADAVQNRVLVFDLPFESGKVASRVIGQPDFSSIAPGSERNQFRSPHGISGDGSNRLYVADTANNRVLIFGDYRTEPANPSAAREITGLRSPWDVDVSSATGKAWVADTNVGRAVRYPAFNDFPVIGEIAPEFVLPAINPLAVEADPFGNPYFADAANRVVAHFQLMAVLNGANFLPRDTANPSQGAIPGRTVPGMIASLFFLEAKPIEFAVNTNPSRLPLELGDVQVLFNEEPVPLYFVQSTQVNFLVPNDAPTSGFAQVTVIRPSTGQTFASARVQMDVALPGFFTASSTGTGPMRAINDEDKQINSAATPATAGRYISLYATGCGHVPGAPEGGEVVPIGTVIHTPVKPRVQINAIVVLESDIQFSGLAPGFAGLWQINVKIPADTPAGEHFVIMSMRDRLSGDPELPGGTIVPTIFVKR